MVLASSCISTALPGRPTELAPDLSLGFANQIQSHDNILASRPRQQRQLLLVVASHHHLRRPIGRRIMHGGDTPASAPPESQAPPALRHVPAAPRHGRLLALAPIRAEGSSSAASWRNARPAASAPRARGAAARAPASSPPRSRATHPGSSGTFSAASANRHRDAHPGLRGIRSWLLSAARSNNALTIGGRDAAALCATDCYCNSAAASSWL